MACTPNLNSLVFPFYLWAGFAKKEALSYGQAGNAILFAIDRKKKS